MNSWEILKYCDSVLVTYQYKTLADLFIFEFELVTPPPLAYIF